MMIIIYSGNGGGKTKRIHNHPFAVKTIPDIYTLSFRWRTKKVFISST